MSKRAPMRETELAEPIVAWLEEQHWDVYQEVQFRHQGGVADIVAVRHGIVWIIETKVTYGLAVLRQATDWRAPLRSVGVAMIREPRDYRVAKEFYKVGVIEVGTAGRVDEVIRPPILREYYAEGQQKIQQLTDLHRTFAKAGSKGGYHLTPYKQTMLDVKGFVEEHPGCTLKEIHDALGEMHYSSRSSFMGNMVSALATFEREWCRVDASSRPFRFYIKEQQ